MKKASYAGTALLAGALIVLVFVVIVFRRDQKDYQTLADRAEHIHQIIDIAPAALSALKDAETGQRGYLLTGKPSYLVPYSTGIHQYRQLAPALGILTLNDPAAGELVRRISKASRQKLDELAATISLYNEGKKQAALEHVNSDSGKEFMDEVRARTAELVVLEEMAFAAANRATSDAVRNTRDRFFAATAMLSLFMILGTILLSFQLRTERRLLQSVEQSKQRYRELTESLEQQIAERTRNLEDANSSLNAFSYSVSHDLRAPLRSIDGFSLMVLEDYADRLDEPGRDMLRRIRAAATRMGILIQSLLDLSRVTGTELSRERVSLSSVARSIVEGFRAAAPERSVEVVIAPGLEANADPHLTRVVLDNLLSNAWKFSSKTTFARIELGKTNRAGRDAFFVRDNGAGFDSQFSERLFTPFQRLHSASDFDGAGIGLATVQRVILRHDGKIWAESAPGEGATFFFTLEGVR